MPARKAWRDLSPDYRKRMQGKGFTARNWNTKKGDAMRAAARGHATTPERPSQAVRNPERFQRYLDDTASLLAKVKARKKALWGDVHGWNGKRAMEAAELNPLTGARIDRALMKRFLAMPQHEAEEMASRASHAMIRNEKLYREWAFLFYH